MKINTSYVIAVGLVILIAAWFFLHRGDAQEKANSGPKTAQIEAKVDMPEVVYEAVTAQPHPNRLRLYGRTQAHRTVDVKAETAGLIAATPITEGRRVKQGAVLCRQDIDARQANLDQAVANLAAREFDLNSTQTLVDKGFKSAIQLQSLKAAVDGAKAQVKQARIELDNVNMRAPFNGIFDQQMAEVGDYLLPGQPCGKLVELDPLVVEVQLTEEQVGQVDLGQEIDLTLATGEKKTGQLKFVEAGANPATRTFRSEIHLPNKDYAMKGGVTADVVINAGSTMAQRIPGKILTLDNDGTIGVRHLDREDRVQFSAIKIIDESPDGIWVTGLPNNARIIVEGQDFVSIGTKVKPRTTIYQAATQ